MPNSAKDLAETEADRHSRFALEVLQVAEARAEIETGLFIEEAEVDAWLDSLGTDHELPMPSPHR